ncbi:hypothetical protein AB2N04_17180 [Nitratireductor sp. GISD-1A_MAKvit]|uniref:hypothetical protein n=1 Tax=Nitratireductor sp. GISD-1A_MAKvit TaxID=3234198 RepID=UPI00346738A5
MTPCLGNTSWFENLRHEAKLFAAVGFFSLLMGLLQPLALAAAAPASHGFVICTTYGIGTASDEGGKHSRMAQCPLCLSGHACGFQFSSATPNLPALVLPSWLGDGTVVPGWHVGVRINPACNTAHAIRAPPAPA